MIRINSIDAEPVLELRYLNARSGGGSEVSRLPFLRTHVGAFGSHELEAIVCCSDLQGMVAGRLLGVELDRMVDKVRWTVSEIRTALCTSGLVDGAREVVEVVH